MPKGAWLSYGSPEVADWYRVAKKAAVLVEAKSWTWDTFGEVTEKDSGMHTLTLTPKDNFRDTN